MSDSVDPRDGNPPGSPVPGILQARTLEWLAISFSNAWKWKVKVKSLRLSTWKLHSHVRLLVTPWTAVYQAALSMGFSRQGYWSGVPLPSPKGGIDDLICKRDRSTNVEAKVCTLRSVCQHSFSVSISQWLLHLSMDHFSWV